MIEQFREHNINYEYMKNTRFLKSSYLNALNADDANIIIWHSLFGNPKLINKNTLFLLNIFNKSKTISSVIKQYDINNKQIFDHLILNYFLIPETFNEREYLSNILENRAHNALDGSLVNYLELRISETCNFNCIYCIQKNIKRIKLSRYKVFMDFSVAKKSIDVYIDLLMRHKKDIAEITFSGGEPTLNWEIILKTVDYAENNFGKSINFKFYLNTNFSLIDKERAKIIKDRKIDVFPSIDGLKNQNDKVRISKDNKSSFELIMKSIKNLKDVGIKIRGISTTTNENNFFDLDEKFIEWIYKNKFRMLQINIDVMNLVYADIDHVVMHLIELIKYCKELGIEVSGFWRRPAENLLNNSIINEDVGFCGAAKGHNLCVDPLGDIYSCGYSNFQIGNIYNFGKFFNLTNPYYEFILNNTPTFIDYCKGCMLEGSCGGGCIITREFAKKKKSGIKKINQMCDFYKAMTKEVLLKSYKHF